MQKSQIKIEYGRAEVTVKNNEYSYYNITSIRIYTNSIENYVEFPNLHRFKIEYKEPLILTIDNEIKRKIKLSETKDNFIIVSDKQNYYDDKQYVLYINSKNLNHFEFMGYVKETYTSAYLYENKDKIKANSKNEISLIEFYRINEYAISNCTDIYLDRKRRELELAYRNVNEIIDAFLFPNENKYIKTFNIPLHRFIYARDVIIQEIIKETNYISDIYNELTIVGV